MTTIPSRELPEAGDLVRVNFEPVLGSEQAGERPALVLSARRFHEVSRRAIVCPITRNVAPWPTKVVLPDGLGAQGAVLVDQVRSVDRGSRGFRRIGLVPAETLSLVREVLAALLGIDGAMLFDR